MDSPTSLAALKNLLQESHQFGQDIAALKSQQAQLQSSLEALEAGFEHLAHQQFQSGPVSADAYTPILSTHTPDRLLDLPLAKLLDLYHEYPQILEGLAQRVALLPSADHPQLLIESHNQGNYWVLHLQDLGFILLPRPTEVQRLARLESLAQLFTLVGVCEPEQRSQFILHQPASLQLLKRYQRWQLQTPGKLEWGKTPLGQQWQQQLEKIQQQYATLMRLLDKVGEAGLEATLQYQYWQQQLVSRYGELVTIMINTCMPIAYGIYKGPTLVPFNVLMGKKGQVVPAWDRGIPWETSVYAKFHSKLNKDYLRSRADHPLLPNQIYLKEINGSTNHTWAIAKSYAEADAIVCRLSDHWGPLD